MILINRCVCVYIYQHISPICLKKKTCLMSFHFLFFPPQHNPPVCIHNCYSFPLTEELQSAIIHREAHNDFLATQTAVPSHTLAHKHTKIAAVALLQSVCSSFSPGDEALRIDFFFFLLCS